MKRVTKKLVAAPLAACCLSGAALYAAASSSKAGSSEFLPDRVAPAAKFSKASFVEQLQTSLEQTGVESALSLYVILPEEYEDDFDLLFLKAALYVSAQKYKEAKELCAQLNLRDPKNQDVIALAATIAKAQGNSAERTKQLKALLALDQYNADANIELAEDSFVKKNYKQSRQYYQKALVRDPKNQEALFGVGQTSYFLEDDAKAESTFKKILFDDPGYAPAYSYLGKLAAAHSEYKVASDYVKKAVELDAGNYDYIMDYGMYERYLGHYDEAEAAWTKAIAIDPSYFLAYAYRAGLYDEQEKLGKALKDYQKVVQLNPDYYFAYESIGVLALHEEKWTLARNAFLKCYEYNKENVSYPLMVTYCYYKEKKPQDAKTFSEQVYRKMDNTSMNYAMLRTFHDLAGEMPLPQKISRLQNKNERIKMYYYLGLLYELKGGVESSRSCFAKVVESNTPLIFEYRLAEWSVGTLADIQERERLN